MLGYWQIGDVDMMHKYYADDVTSVSGEFEPPLFGWDSYVKAYQSQRARTQAVRMDRVNTYTKVMGDTAWATYQWQFSGQVDGKTTNALGYTTLALEKVTRLAHRDEPHFRCFDVRPRPGHRMPDALPSRC